MVVIALGSDVFTAISAFQTTHDVSDPPDARVVISLWSCVGTDWD
jgi:hypothetical protein